MCKPERSRTSIPGCGQWLRMSEATKLQSLHESLRGINAEMTLHNSSINATFSFMTALQNYIKCVTKELIYVRKIGMFLCTIEPRIVCCGRKPFSHISSQTYIHKVVKHRCSFHNQKQHLLVLYRCQYRWKWLLKYEHICLQEIKMRWESLKLAAT